MPPIIRGVNLGGWLVLERYIAPSLFAITTCDVDPSLSTNSTNTKCEPVQPYPVDQYTLGEAFGSREEFKEHLEPHWDTFLTEADIVAIKEANLSHVRVPVGHWIMGDVSPGEPYVPGEWPYFVRASEWCRKHGLQVWVDLHTAPGSQNGFDNSGRTLPTPTGAGWSGSPSNIDRTVDIVRGIAEGIKNSGLSDVVTGFGVLNEPFKGENSAQVRDFDARAFEAVREVLGEGVTVYIGDMFDAGEFQGFWDEPLYSNTLLDR